MYMYTCTYAYVDIYICTYICICLYAYMYVMGVMKMGTTMPSAGLNPTSLAFPDSVLPLHHVGFPDVTTIPMSTCLCSSLPLRSVQTTTLIPLEL